MSGHKPTHKELPFGWVNDNPDHATRVPIVNFDYESVFQQLDGDTPEVKPQTPDPQPLIEILSPNELQHAFSVAKAILRRSSPRSRATCASWRNPASRDRRLAALRLSWRQTRDRQKAREVILKLWRERRPELLAKMRAGICSPENRRRASNHFLAMWANPIMRQKTLARRLTPESRLRQSIAMRRYFQEHPEARKRSAARARAMWRNPAFRLRCSRTLFRPKIMHPLNSQPSTLNHANHPTATVGI